jgi:nicotinamidase-related amidase
MPTGAQENDHLLDAVALLVLDVQERLLPAMADAEAFTDRVAFAIEAARHFKLKVIFTEQVPEKLGPTLPRLRQLAPGARVFKKSSFSALQATGLQDYLRDQNIYHLLICGLETPVCVYQTALQAADLDHDTTLLSDCLASRRPEDDAFVLPALTRSGCHLLPSETVFYSMVADASRPVFRGFSELVKRHDAIRSGERPPESDKEPVDQKPVKSEPKPKPARKKRTRSKKPAEPDPLPQSAEPVEGRPPPSVKRSRGRRRKTPKPEEATEKPETKAEAEPIAMVTVETNPETEEKEVRKPRRRKRGSRKSKAAAAPKHETPTEPEN